MVLTDGKSDQRIERGTNACANFWAGMKNLSSPISISCGSKRWSGKRDGVYFWKGKFILARF